MKQLCPTLLALGIAVAAATCAELRPRLLMLMLTDIGGDSDDQQSLVRLLLYSNEFEIEGLIASASGTPGELKKSIVNPQLIRDDEMTFRWWRYREPGSSPGELELNDSDQAVAELKVPEINQPGNAHLILEVTDHGKPALTSFRRVVVDLLPGR
jgi:hypothetical protein